MFCRNCGKEIDERAAICVGCGFAKGIGDKFCGNCGKEVAPGAAVCMNCGFAIEDKPVVDESLQKSKLVAGLLGILLGGLGIHNFYLGYTSKAVIDIVLSLFCGIGAIWGLIEGIMILTGNIAVDANGVPLKE